MKITPITDPLPGEHVVAIEPTMRLELEPGAPRRLNFFPGRAVSHTALTGEQLHRTRRLADAARLLSPGVVRGLEVSIEHASSGEDAPELQDYYYIAAGSAVTAGGENVHLPRDQRIAITAVPLADGGTFGELAAAEPDFPSAGILVLRPVTVELRGGFDPQNPCEEDPASYAFEDWQRIDGCRLLYVPWPVASLALPDRLEPTGLWRNQLAAAVFQAEEELGPGELLPWQAVGAPIALVGFDAAWRPLFADRSTVVRPAGGLKRSVHLPGRGKEHLWQARIEQLAEQIVESQRAGTATAELAEQFTYLPPVGLLPSDAVVLRHRTQDVAISGDPSGGHFMLSADGKTSDKIAFNADAAAVQQALNDLGNLPEVTAGGGPLPGQPIRLEFAGPLDRPLAITADGSGLAGGNAPRVTVRSAESVRPNPLRQFFPDHFHLDVLPIPAEQLDAVARRGAGLSPLDAGAAERIRVLVPVAQAVYEPQLLMVEQVAAEFPETLAEFIARRAEWLKRRSVVRDIAGSLLAALRGQRPSFPDPDPDALEDNEQVAESVEPEEEPYGTQPVPNAPPAVIALDELRAELKADLPLSEEERKQLDELGLLRFIEFLEDKVRRADDKIDLGFARFMTDNYRIRQLVLGEEQATRLATSPVFADIAKGATAAATKTDITLALQKMKGAGPLGAAPLAGNGNAGLAPTAGGGIAPLPIGRRESARGAFELAPDLLPQISIEIPRATKPASPLTDIQAVKQQTASSAKLFQGQTLIYGQNYLVGKPELFRTTTIAERLKNRPANEAKNAAVSNFYEAVRSLLELDLSVDDLPVSGLPAYAPDGRFADVGDPLPTSREIPNPPPGFIIKELVPTTLGELRKPDQERGRLAEKILRYPDPPNGDESAFFSVAVDVLEHTVALYRRGEGRVQQYRAAIARCRQTLDVIDEHFTAADRRLKIIADELAEARHDVGVARALLAEEESRVDAINHRRDQILAGQVEFLAYCRPRTAGLSRSVPVHSLEPGLLEPPLPVCLARAVDVPAELREMVDLFRQAPIKWFPRIAAGLDKLDRPEVLQDTLRQAKSRAGSAVLALPQPAPSPPAVGLLGKALGNVVQLQRTAIQDTRATTARVDLAVVGQLTWQGARDEVRQAVSLGDLLDTPHGRSELTRAVTELLDQIAHVSGCLYSLFGQQRPATRLMWAERLGQFDEPVNLRNLAALPRWGEVSFLDRQRTQALVDFLYAQVDLRETPAVALISDLVRVCILLASHAPVERIVAGQLAEPATVRPGGQVKVQVDPAKVRIGMSVLMYQANRVVARGVVEDLAGGRASARIVHALDTTIQLNQGARVQFTN